MAPAGVADADYFGVSRRIASLHAQVVPARNDLS
jgi:hypothetical protein